MLFGEGDELVDVRGYSFHSTLHGWDGVAAALEADSLAHDGAEEFHGGSGGATGVHSCQVATEDEDFAAS